MKSKRIFERQAQPSLKELGHLWEYVRTLPSATAVVNIGEGTVVVRFVIDNESGWIKLKAKPAGLRDSQEVNQRRAIAAARTQMGGRPPMVWDDVKAILAKNITYRALRMLTSPDHYDIVGGKFPGPHMH